MASPATNCEPPDLDEDTDYGSDFSPEEELIVAQLLSLPTPEVLDDNPIVNDDIEIDLQDEGNQHRQTLRLPRVFGREERSPLFQAAMAAEKVAEQIHRSVGGEGDQDLGTRIPEPDPEVAEIPLETLPEEANAIDTRSPLERFRTAPKKAFSVTDLVSPAWCELQYWYTLTKHGKKRRTPEMRQGSVVHQKLEDQVHTTVRVEVTTKEDAWALRIWNVIQGLKTLRYTGLTRELEIWGTVDGLVVNGVIDELSYVCPDTVLEDRMERPQTRHEPPPNQTTIADFFRNGSSGGTSMAEAMMAEPRTPSTKVYLCDVKTRGVRKLPVESAFKPTKIQLMLYHRLLTELATNSVDFTVITSRYKLDTDRVFSDSFLAQVGSVDGGIEPDDMSEDGQPSSQDSMETLLAHNNLSKLWVLMIQEFQITLPKGAASLGNVLKAEYRSRDEGEIIGSKTFPMQESVLTEYLDHEMQWWKGNREPEGVVVEEAFKCRSCEFADGCEWRLKKVEEAKAKSRMGRKKSAAV